MAIQALQTKPAFHGFSCFHSHASRFQSLLCPYPSRKPHFKLNCSSNSNNNGDQDYYLLDAPVSAGDGFSFSGGKYSDEPSPSDEWFKQGKMVKAYSISGSGEKAKDPIFGLTMGPGSQATGDCFRWFCVEVGSADNPSVILIHGFPSQLLICFIISPRLALVLEHYQNDHQWDKIQHWHDSG